MQLVAQILILSFLVFNMFSMMYWDINGRKAKEPKGFEGVIGTIIAVAIVFVIYYYAGAYSLIF